MQFFSIAASVYFLICGIFAQNLFSQSRISLTLKPTLAISLPLSGTNSLGTAVAQPGLSLGGFVGYTINEHVKIVSGVDSKLKSIQYNYSYRDEESNSMRNTSIGDAIHQIGIPLLVCYYFDSVNQGFFLSGGPSVDIFISGSTIYGGFPFNLSNSYYSKIEYTIEFGAGEDIVLGDRFRMEFSVSYSYPIVSPYPDSEIAKGWAKISIFRFGIGLTYLF